MLLPWNRRRRKRGNLIIFSQFICLSAPQKGMVKFMNREELYDGITDIREDLIDKTEKHIREKRRRRRKAWMAATAAVLTLAILAGTLFGPLPIVPGTRPSPASPGGRSNYMIAQAAYPRMAPYPDEASYYNEMTGDFDDEAFSEDYDAWATDRRERLALAENCDADLEPFFTESAREFLGGSSTENRVYSPLNVYLALGMLAELTDGDSRQQILEVLGEENLKTLRAQASALWNTSYYDDGATASILASSLWLNENIRFVPSTLDTLAKTYYASSYQGEMGSQAFDQALADWLNQQTGGLLREQAAGIHLEPETVLALATTIYFQAKWRSFFPENETAPEIFHGKTGDITCNFLHASQVREYYWGDHFSAIPLPLENEGSMYILLPDEGVSAEELLDDPQAMAFLLSGGQWEHQRSLTVNISLPKFDVVSDMDLISGLQNLGIRDVFDPAVSDFSPMTRDQEDIYVSQAKHAARVQIDEEGCTAAAYTVIAMSGGGAMSADEEIDFVADRPFLFVITSPGGLPLFTGIVNQPG